VKEAADFVEWRVTGELTGYGPVDVWFSDDLGDDNAEDAARQYVTKFDNWQDGPFLLHRRVTRTAWTLEG